MMRKKSIGVISGYFFFLANYQGFLYFNLWVSSPDKTEHIASGGHYRFAIPSKQFCGITYKATTYYEGVFHSVYVGVDQIVLTYEGNEFFDFKTKIIFDKSSKIRFIKGDPL
jgi:hypothetical protein